MRRIFSRLSLVSVVATALCSCVSVPDESSEPQAFSFVQMCDTQLGMGGYEHDIDTFKQAVKQINAIKPDFVVICGDLVGRPERHTFTDFNAVKDQLDMPCYCVPGNHDVGNKPTKESLASYRKEVGKDFFSISHKGYSFLFVNTQLWKAPVEKESERQDVWLRQALAKASRNGMPVFVVGHHPLYCKQPDEEDGYYNLSPAKRGELLALFDKHGVVAVLTGHAHRAIINDYNGIQLVTGQTTSRTHGSPLGFRLWHVKKPRPFKHESVSLEGL